MKSSFTRLLVGSTGRCGRGDAHRRAAWLLVSWLLLAANFTASAQEQEQWLTVATALQQQAAAAQSAGRATEAVQLLNDALNTLRLAYGARHPILAPYLEDLATVEESRKAYPRALKLRQEALELTEQRLGPAHPELSPNLIQLAWLYWSQGQLAQADVCFQRAFVCNRDERQAPADVLSALLYFAQHYRQEGARERAEALYQRRLWLQEQAKPPNEAAMVATLSTLAELAGERGEYARAEALLQRALPLIEAHWRTRPLETAALLARLAQLATTQAEYGRAELLALRAQAEFAKQQGPRELRQAMVLLDLGAMFAGLGALEQASRMYRQALELERHLLGPAHPQVATTLLALADVYRDWQQPDTAVQLAEEAVAIRENKLGPRHPELAAALAAVAALYALRGDNARAATLYRMALAIQEALPGKVRTAELLLSAARFYQGTRALGEARTLLQRALSAALVSTGPRSVISAAVTFELAGLYHAQAQLPQALALYRRAFDIYEAKLRQLPTESLILAQLRRERPLEDAIYSLLLVAGAEEAVQRLALTVALLRKGRAVDEGAATGQAILQSLNSPEQRREFANLRNLRREHVNLVWQESAGLPADPQHLERIEGQTEALERKLAAVSQPLRTLRLPDSREIIAAVARELPADGALVEVVTVRHRLDGTAAPAPASQHFVALILFADGKIETVKLGAVAPIEQAANRWLALLRTPHSDPHEAGTELYQQLMEPLLSRLAGKQRLYVSADGVLNLIPWGALPAGKESLLERFQIHYLTSGRDLLRKGSAEARSGALVIADPDFRYDVEAADLPADSLGSALSAGLYTQLGSVSALPGTRKEAARLHKLLPEATILVGQAATRRALLEAVAPRALHIATHGIFLASSSTPTLRAGGMRGTGALRHFAVLEPGASAAPAEPPSDNPLARSALLLSGAAARSGQGLAQQGVVTAKEVASMNLWGTQLVVLSACDTGRGTLEVGQGVYGLRRAFLVAGAESLVSSLWQVADAETADLMERYYQNMLAGQGRGEAMRSAALWMKRRKTHPYYWAGFLVIGRDAPLVGTWGTPAHPPKLIAGAKQSLARAVAAIEHGRTKEAEGLYQQALSEPESGLGPQQSEVASTLLEMAALYDSQKAPEKAELLFQRALRIQESIPDAPSTAVIAARLGLASHYERAGAPALAVPLYQSALLLQETTFGPRQRDAAAILTRLAWAYAAQGASVAAIAAARRAHDILDEELGALDPQTTAASARIGEIYIRSGQLAEAEAVFRSVLVAVEGRPEHRPTAVAALSGLADAYGRRGDDIHATGALADALSIQEAALGPQHPAVEDLFRKLLALFGQRRELAATRGDLLWLHRLATDSEALERNFSITLHRLAGLCVSMRERGTVPPFFLHALQRVGAQLAAQRRGADPAAVNDLRELCGAELSGAAGGLQPPR